MAEIDSAAPPLEFTVHMPCDAHFCPAVTQMAAKVASSLGYSADEVDEVRSAIERAFAEAGPDGLARDVQVSVTMRGGGEAMSATVSCDAHTLLELSRPHSL